MTTKLQRQIALKKKLEEDYQKEEERRNNFLVRKRIQFKIQEKEPDVEEESLPSLEYSEEEFKETKQQPQIEYSKEKKEELKVEETSISEEEKHKITDDLNRIRMKKEMIREKLEKYQTLSLLLQIYLKMSHDAWPMS